MKDKRKIKSKKLIYKGIKFDSELEIHCYKALEEANIKFTYNEKTFTLKESFRPTITIINNYYKSGRNKKKRFTKYETKILDELYIDKSKIGSIKYTPDFIIERDNKTIFIETKGYANESYPYRKKLFISYLEKLKDNKEYTFVELRNKKQINLYISNL